MNKLISVIVPVYNVEKYIERCIESLLSQTYNNLEIILVDDGSTDKSKEICESKKNCDERICLIGQNNMGVAAARNKGMLAANGDYYAFVDSDDALQEDYFEKMMSCIEGTDYEMCVCSSRRFCKDEELVDTRKSEDYVVQDITPREAQLRGFIGPDAMIWMTVWGKLFKKTVIGDTKFLEGRIYEDAEFIGRIYEKVNKIAFIDQQLYYYRVNPNGIMHSKVSTRNFDVMKLHEEFAQRFKEKGDFELYRYSRIRYLEVVKQLCIQAKRTKADVDVQDRFLEMLLLLYEEVGGNEKNKRLIQEMSILVKSKELYFIIELLKEDYKKIIRKIKGCLRKMNKFVKRNG